MKRQAFLIIAVITMVFGLVRIGWSQDINAVSTDEVNIQKKIEDIQDRREDIRDRREDIRDRRGDVSDRRKDIRGRRDDVTRPDRLRKSDREIRRHKREIRGDKRDIRNERRITGQEIGQRRVRGNVSKGVRVKSSDRKQRR